MQAGEQHASTGPFDMGKKVYMQDNDNVSAALVHNAMVVEKW